MSNSHFRTIRVLALALSVVGVAAQSHASAGEVDAADGHTLARRLIQPAESGTVSAEPVRQSVSVTSNGAHEQAVALIRSGSVAGPLLPPAPATAMLADHADPHQSARAHLRWTQVPG